MTIKEKINTVLKNENYKLNEVNNKLNCLSKMHRKRIYNNRSIFFLYVINNPDPKKFNIR